MRHCAVSNHSGAELFPNKSTARPIPFWLQLQKFLPRWDVAVAALLMSLVSFSLPGRKGPDAGDSIDTIAAVKFTIRLLVLAWFGVIWLLDCRQSLLQLTHETGLRVSDLVSVFVFRGHWTDRVFVPWCAPSHRAKCFGIEGIDNASAYVQRGQTSEELQQVSGRAELWQAVWQHFLDSPICGHGYFVTSSTGKLDAWEGPSNQDAHNIVLQVLVTTGIVGGGLHVGSFGQRHSFNALHSRSAGHASCASILVDS